MKKSYVLLLALILSLTSSAYADDATGTVDAIPATTSATPLLDSPQTSDEVKTPKMGNEERKKLKDEIKMLKGQNKDFVKENRVKIKENLESFKSENGKAKDAFTELTTEQKTALKELNTAHKAEVKALQEKFKSMEKTDENMNAHREEVEAMRAAHFAKIQEIVWDNAKASAFVEARKSVFEENSQMRKENTQARIETRGSIEEKVVQYKEAFAKKLVDKLPKIKEDKLQKLADNVTKMITKTEANTKMKQENKDKILSQLTSLKELIDEELENRAASAEEINIDEIVQ